MPTALASLKKSAWNGIEFPVRTYSVKGSLHHHVHKYPHAKVGAFENLERNAYEIHMAAFFLERLQRYPDLWPGKLRTLRQQFETGDRGKLYIPTIGEIEARCVNWTQEMDVKIQSGERVELTFIEDQSQDSLSEAIIQSSTIASIVQNFGEVAKDQLGYTPDIFQSITNVANELFAITDWANTTGDWIESKILGLDALVRRADTEVTELQDPENWAVFNALRELWLSCDKLAKDITGTGTEIKQYIVPTQMTIAEVSTAIYGDSSHAVDLLQINGVDDALAIPANTVIDYFAIEGTLAAA